MSSKESQSNTNKTSQADTQSLSSALSGSLFSTKEGNSEYGDESFELESEQSEQSERGDINDEDYNADFENTVDFSNGRFLLGIMTFIL